ncbi:Zinc finger MYM-type protein 5 [Orchesella cincta]|uniref:Zinc finger MYM-type protein 5 n=1 Tax=Orchesella cincta TaxID=48709 RepID=A0A1D2MBU1_ORCCI|nr:Zinc finger MYM-type protein 5 [Orchesella cincta]
MTIMQLGPCQPEIDFPENSRGRRFAASYYQLKTATGLRIQRKWLCYSLKLDKVYCETCWLFGNRNSPHYRSEWTNGIDDWQHLTQKIITHETSMSHIQSMKSRIDYEDNKTIKSSFDREILREADKWKQVLQRIFKTILSLCASNNPLRGHKENLDAYENPGNFLRELKLIAEFDPILRDVLHDKNQKIKYLSHKIQDEIIQIKHSYRSAKGYEALILDILKGLNLSFAMCVAKVTMERVGLRWKELESIYFEGGSLRKQCESITLKAVCETRWEARHASVLAIKVRYVDILKAVAKIILTSKKKNEVSEAVGIKNRIENFQFIVTLVFWEKILRSFSVLSKKLQSIEVTLDECVIMWQNGIETLESLKRNICGINEEAKELARKWGVPEAFPSVRKIKKNRFHDGLGIDTARKNGINRGGVIRERILAWGGAGGGGGGIVTNSS